VKILQQLREEGRADDMQALVEHIPYARFLGVNVDQTRGEMITVMPFKDTLVGNINLPAIHGGAIGALLELTAVIQLLLDTSCEKFPKTVDFSIDYLRPGKPIETYGRAIVTRQGRRVANVRTELWQDDPSKLIAIGHGHFLLAPV
jgi:uncharacterized protein (TIGR00369 family)